MSKLYDLLYTMIGKLNSSVKTTAQTLTDAEKTQARANIGAQVTGDYAEKKDIPTVPTKVSAFTNDAGYLTQHQDLSAYAKKTEIPSKLPNPYALTINGNTYDGSSAVSVTVEGGGSGGGAQSDWSAAEGQPGHVLNRTHWAEGGDVLLSHTITDNNSMRVKAGIGLVAGNEYTVTVNGVEDTYVAQEVTEDGFKFVVLTTPEWKIMDCSPEAAALSGYGATFNPYAFSGALPVAITIATAETIHKLDPKFLPDGVPYTEITKANGLPETTIDTSEGQGIIYTATDILPGGLFTVTYNGVEYECEAQDADGAAILGDGTLVGGVGNGEPFLLMFVPDNMVAELGYGGMLMALDGSTSVTVKIEGYNKTVHKMGEEFIPEPPIVNTGEHGIGELMLDGAELNVDLDEAEQAAIRRAKKSGILMVGVLMELNGTTTVWNCPVTFVSCLDDSRGSCNLPDGTFLWIQIIGTIMYLRRMSKLSM